MTVTVNCHKCGRLLRSADKYAGRRVKCPDCETINQYPGSSGESEDAAAQKHGKSPLNLGVNCQCGQSIRLESQHAGKLVQCRSCGRVYRVPQKLADAHKGPFVEVVCGVCGKSFSSSFPGLAPAKYQEGGYRHQSCASVEELPPLPEMDMLDALLPTAPPEKCHRCGKLYPGEQMKSVGARPIRRLCARCFRQLEVTKQLQREKQEQERQQQEGEERLRREELKKERQRKGAKRGAFWRRTFGASVFGPSTCDICGKECLSDKEACERAMNAMYSASHFRADPIIRGDPIRALAMAQMSARTARRCPQCARVVCASCEGTHSSCPVCGGNLLEDKPL